MSVQEQVIAIVIRMALIAEYSFFSSKTGCYYENQNLFLSAGITDVGNYTLRVNLVTIFLTNLL